ncbi:MAG: YbaY family lipoprotein [Pseudomonadota bacterium]
MQKTIAGMVALFLGMLMAISATAEEHMLEISVTYRERIALPPDALLELELLDTSRMDVAAERLSMQRFRMTSVPFVANLSFDPALIDDRLSYTVAAKIMSAGRVIFRTTQAYPVLTRGAGTSADLTLQAASASAPAPTMAALVGETWQAFEVSGRLLVTDTRPTLQFEREGQFSMFSGCNTFRGRAEISDGTVAFPDNMAGTLMACPPEQMELERAVLDAVSQSTGFVLSESGLVLVNTAGLAVLRFQPQS